MKLLVFGRTGQVARELARRRPGDAECRFLDRDAADLASPENCARVIGEAEADAVINAAAWTDVDGAEANEEMAMKINGEAPGAMARACAEKGIPFLHVSTDHVFDGSGSRSFSPRDATGPLNAYGRTKLAGEEAVRASGARHLILRTSWIFSAHGQNFVKTILRLGAGRESLDVVSDQTGGPTPAAAVADALCAAARAMIAGHPGGTYHFAGAPDAGKADFAREILHMAGMSREIRNMPTLEYPALARRPLNSRLDCTAFVNEFGVRRPDWREGLSEVLKEIGVNQ